MWYRTPRNRTISNVPDVAGCQAADIVDDVFDFRIQQLASLRGTASVLRIDRHHLRSAALHFEAEPAVPGADVEHALAGQVGWNRMAVDPLAKLRHGLQARKNRPVRQFDRVVAAQARKILAQADNCFGGLGVFGLDPHGCESWFRNLVPMGVRAPVLSYRPYSPLSPRPSSGGWSKICHHTA